MYKAKVRTLKMISYQIQIQYIILPLFFIIKTVPEKKIILLYIKFLQMAEESTNQKTAPLILLIASHPTSNPTFGCVITRIKKTTVVANSYNCNFHILTLLFMTIYHYFMTIYHSQHLSQKDRLLCTSANDHASDSFCFPFLTSIKFV